MARLQYSLNDYLAYVIISNHKRLLVEGPDDNRLFNKLFDVFDKERDYVDVDDASSLISIDQPLGNREKVELVCATVIKTNYANKLVGFVDREYRGFLWNPDLKDDIGCHRVDGRLVWTRGHSVENYYFDFETLRDPISTLSTTPYYRAALGILKKNFTKVIRLACAASLTGMEIGNFQIIRSAISWKIFDIVNGELCFDLAKLGSVFRERNIEEVTISQIMARFPYWETITSRAEFDIVRWMCHGHIGLTFIWSSYKRIVYEVSVNEKSDHPDKDAARSIDAKDEIRFNACAKRWIERSLGNEEVFPFEILKMLDLLQ